MTPLRQEPDALSLYDVERGALEPAEIPLEVRQPLILHAQHRQFAQMILPIGQATFGIVARLVAKQGPGKRIAEDQLQPVVLPQERARRGAGRRRDGPRHIFLPPRPEIKAPARRRLDGNLEDLAWRHDGTPGLPLPGREAAANSGSGGHRHGKYYNKIRGLLDGRTGEVVSLGEAETRARLADRRAGIEPLSGHAKQGGQLGQSRMKTDDTTLAAGYRAIGGFNLRQLRHHWLGKDIKPMG
jgi:hypothetical protein